MSQHRARVEWQFAGGEFLRGRYSRVHRWSFDGGLSVAASPAPAIYPAPWSSAAAVDPEEAFVAAVASCHMMSFLYVAARAGYEVLGYTDDAVGTLAKNAEGRRWIEAIVLCPHIAYGTRRPDAAQERALHDQAHAECYIANSIRSTVRVLAPPD